MYIATLSSVYCYTCLMNSMFWLHRAFSWVPGYITKVVIHICPKGDMNDHRDMLQMNNPHLFDVVEAHATVVMPTHTHTRRGKQTTQPTS